MTVHSALAFVTRNWSQDLRADVSECFLWPEESSNPGIYTPVHGQWLKRFLQGIELTLTHVCEEVGQTEIKNKRPIRRLQRDEDIRDISLVFAVSMHGRARLSSIWLTGCVHGARQIPIISWCIRELLLFLCSSTPFCSGQCHGVVSCQCIREVIAVLIAGL